MDALLGVERIYIGSDRYPINVIPERTVAKWTGSVSAMGWRSVTPFLPPLRHRARRDRTVTEEQAAISAERVCGLRPVLVQKRHGPGGLGEVSPLLAHQYLGEQGDGSKRSWTFTRRLGFWLEFTFDQPVYLAAPLGADAHFGAGQFRPC
jgi:CRISPR-associated protein Csb2